MNKEFWLSSLKSKIQGNLFRKPTDLRRGPGRHRRAHTHADIETLETRRLLTADTALLPGVASEYTVYVQDGEYLPVQTDPGTELVNSDHEGDGNLIRLGDWETEGVFDGWAIENGAAPGVNDGALSVQFGTEDTEPLRLSLTSVAHEPNLDFGYNDFLQIRMKLPSGYDQDITFHYDTSTTSGFEAVRSFVLPAAQLVADGDSHDYRIDLGLEVRWRDQLDGFSIEVPTGAWTDNTIEIDSVTLGDQPGDVLMINNLVDYTSEALAAGDATRVESKHGATWYSPSMDQEFDPAIHGRNSLRMLEESYQVFTKVLGHQEPFLGTGSPTAVRGNYALLSFIHEIPFAEKQTDFTFNRTVIVDGRTLTLEATLDASINDNDASLYNNSRGVFPVQNGFTGGGGGNIWSDSEDLRLTFRVLEDDHDVSQDFALAISEGRAEWRNTSEPQFDVSFHGEDGELYGNLTYANAPVNWRAESIKAETPILLGSDSVRLNLSPTFDDHFRLQDLEIVVTPVGTVAGVKQHELSMVPNYDLDRYKLNTTTWRPGYFAGNYKGFAALRVGTNGLRSELPGNPFPHEFAHAVQSSSIRPLDGGHWESHADFMRAQWADYFSANIPNYVADLGSRPLRNSNLRQDSQGFRYDDFRIHEAMQTHAASVGLDPSAATQLWRLGDHFDSAYGALAEIVPDNVSVADVMGGLLRHWSVLDFSRKQPLRKHFGSTDRDEAFFHYQTGSHLVPAHDAPGWLRVPFSRAPEKYAYMSHELVPTDSTVNLELRGVDVAGEGEDWRWSLIAINEQEELRYSGVWGPGEHSFALNPDETRVLLVVVATPDDLSLDTSSYFSTKASDKHLDRLRYPYEIRVSGADIKTKRLDIANGPTGDFHVNPDGSPGGWVDSTATVASTVFVGPDARVLGFAEVTGTARIEDYAVVADRAKVQDNAVVSGFAAILDDASIVGNAIVRDRGVVNKYAKVSENAVVEDYAMVSDRAHVTDSAIARGSSRSFGNSAVISGTAILDHDYEMVWSIADGVAQNHVAFGSYYVEHYLDTLNKPTGLTASYRIEAPEGDVLWDEFGAQHATLRGGPARVIDSDARGEVLSLNGSDQYIVPERGNFNFRSGAVAAWIKPTSDRSDQRLFFAGNADGDFFELIARNSDGHTVGRIHANGVTHEVSSTSLLSLNEWSHVAVGFDRAAMSLYINGLLADQIATTLTPSEVLGDGSYESADPLYIGRGVNGDFFEGQIDDVRFYNVALSPEQIAAEADRRGDVLGSFYDDSPESFDGITTRAESGVRNGLERTLSASIKPQASPDTSYYQAVFDSNDERDHSLHGSGFGVDDGEIVVRLDGHGAWHTGIDVQMGVWQDITVGFDGSHAFLYVDQTLQSSIEYSASLNGLAGKNYRIGFGQDDSSNLFHFDGEIRDAVILDRMLLPGMMFPQLSVSINALLIAESDGISAAVGTVTRASNTTNPLEVTLISDDTSEANVVGSVTIPAGQESATFTINAVDDDLVDGSQMVTISAAAAGHAATSELFEVADDDTFRLTLTLGQRSVSESAGAGASTATVSHNRVTTEELVVSLSSNDTSEARLLSTLTIPSGQSTSAPFDIDAVDDEIVDGNRLVTITASAAGFDDGVDSLTVTDDDVAALTLELSLGTVSENAESAATTATVSRNTEPANELVVTLFSDDTTEANIVGSITIPAGQLTSSPFEISAVDDVFVDGTQTVRFSANAEGFATGNAELAVTDDDVAALTLDVATGSIAENAGTNAVTATVSRNTNTSQELVVSIMSDDLTEAMVIASVTIPAGQTTSPAFGIDAVDDAIIDGTQVVAITAAADGLLDGSFNLLVTDEDVASLMVNLISDSVSENAGAEASTAMVTRNSDTSDELVVILKSDDTTEATVISSVTIPAGQTASAPFSIAVVDDSIVDGTQTATITAEADGHVTGAGVLSIADNDSPALDLNIFNDVVGETSGAMATTGTVSRNTPTNDDLIVTLLSSDTTEATVAATITIPAGHSTSAPFAINSINDSIVDGTQIVTLTAMAAGMLNGTDALTVVDDDVATLIFHLEDGSVAEHSVMKMTTATITRNTDTTNDLVVTLLSSDTTEATIAGTVTIPAGQSQSPSFSVNAMDDSIADGTQTVTLSASAAGMLSGTATLQVMDNDIPSLSLNLLVDTVRENAGASATVGMVTRNTDTSEALVVTLQSNDTGEATVIGSITIASGQTTSAPFDIDAVADSIVDGSQTVTFVATADGLTNSVATLVVADDDVATLTVEILADIVNENAGPAATTATIHRNTATTDDLVVTLRSTDTTEATVIASLTIPSGQTSSAPFSIDAMDDDGVDGTQIVTIIASADGLIDGTDSVAVSNDDVASLTLEIVPGSVSEDGSAMATVSRNTNAAAPVVVTLRSDDTTEATVVDSVTIPSGRTISDPFVVTAVDDELADGSQTVTITATADGLADGTDSLTIQDNDIASLELHILVDSVSENAGLAATTATVIRNTVPATDLIVTLHSDDTTEATVIGSVTIPAGHANSAPFPINAVDDAMVDGTRTVTISASATDHATATQPLIVTNDDLPQVSVFATSTSILEGSEATVTVLLSDPPVSTVSVDIETVDMTARDGVDYTGIAQRLTFESGQTSQTVRVHTIGNSLIEQSRVFAVTVLNPSGVRLADDPSVTASVEIISDDLPTVSVNSVSAEEGAPLEFTVSIDQLPATGQDVTLTAATEPGSAVSPGDFVAANHTFIFSSTDASLSQSFTVLSAEDDLSETDENLLVNLLSVTGATLGAGSGLGTIIDDDLDNHVSISTETAEASESGATTVEFRVTTSRNTTVDETVQLTLSGAGVDSFDAELSETSINIPAGSNTATVTLTILDDSTVEGDELANLEISNPTGDLKIDIATAQIIIRDNDAPQPTPMARFQTDFRPTVRWGNAPAAAAYEIWFSRIAPGEQRLFSEDSIITGEEFTPSAELTPAVYRYWVRTVDSEGIGGRWSSPLTFEIQPRLISPLAPTFNLRPTFTWEEVPHAESYEIFVRTSDGDVVDNNVVGTSWTPTSDLPPGPIRWWIRTSDQTSNQGWSETGTTGLQMTFVTPIGTTNSKTPTLTWEEVEGAGRYIVYVYSLTEGKVAFRDDHVMGTSHTFQSDLSTGSYRVWIKAINRETNSFSSGLWSSKMDFTIAEAETDEDGEDILLAHRLSTKNNQTKRSPGTTQHDRNPVVKYEPGETVNRSHDAKMLDELMSSASSVAGILAPQSDDRRS